jgi:RpiR family transcriptional regulator, carbohydrate utilization regulator
LNAIIELINHYNATSPGDTSHDIAEIVLQNLSALRSLSIDKIAELCFTSAATLSRFARSLGFQSFSAFRANLAASFDNYPFLNHTMPPNRELMEGQSFIHAYLCNLRQVIDQLESTLTPALISQITAMINQSGKISFYSQQVGDFPTLQFQYDLVMAGKTAVILQQYDQQLENARSLDQNCLVIVCLPDTPESAQRLEALREARRHGARILLIKPRMSTTGAKYADTVINYEESRTAMDGYIYNVIISLMTMHFRYNYLS